MGQATDLLQKHYDNVAANDDEANRAIFSPNVVTQAPGAGTLTGIDAFITWGSGFSVAVPDAAMKSVKIREIGNTAIAEGLFVGTNTGPLAGPGGEMPATNKSFELRFSDFIEVENGLIVQHRIYFDQMEFLGQLGLLPGA